MSMFAAQMTAICLSLITPKRLTYPRLISTAVADTCLLKYVNTWRLPAVHLNLLVMRLC